MKKICSFFLPILVLLSPLHGSETRNEVRISDEIPVGIERVSERVLVLNDVPPNGTITAISTSKGIIVIDTGVSWSFGYGFRMIIEREFKRNDFSYVINTHADRDHTFGNQAFGEATIIAHENCREALLALKTAWDVKKNEYVSLHEERAAQGLRELEGVDPGSDEAVMKRRQVAANDLIAADLTEGQEIVPPTETFDDRMTLRSGDITLHIYYMGEGHSNCDVLIHAPQESLLVAGDAFIKSMLICYMKRDRFDMARYREILNAVLNDGTPLKYVVCGHGPFMTGEELRARRDYLDSLSVSISRGRAGGLDLQTAIGRLPLDDYSDLTRLIEGAREELEEEHAALIGRYWSMLQSSDQSE